MKGMETEMYSCKCGYVGERRGHATAEGRVCPFWSQMNAVDWHGLPIRTDESLPRDEVRIVVPPQRMRDLETACRRLLTAYEQEESEHGFPFNMELRAAHRDLAALLATEEREPSDG